MTEPTPEQIKNMVSVTEQWRETPDGRVLFTSWIENKNGERTYLAKDEEVPYERVPYYEIDLTRPPR